MLGVAGTEKVKNNPGIYRYKLANGKTMYAAVATYQGAQKWSRGHKTLVAANDAKAAELAKLKKDPLADISPLLTVKDFLEQHWLPSVDVTPGSYRNYKVAVDNIVKCMGDRRLSLVNQRHGEEFKRWMRERKLSANTRSRTFGRFKQALDYARRMKYIEANPFLDVKAPPKGKHHAPVLSSADLKRLLRAAFATKYGLEVWVPIVTGLRESEVFGALWANLDFATGRLTVIGKGDKQRSVIIDPATLELLKGHRQLQMKKAKELNEKDPRPPVYLFVTPKLMKWSQSSFYHYWDPIRIDALIPEIHYHDLRHVHSTLGSQNGVPIKVMQQRLGHDDATITLNIYTDAEIEEQRPAALAISTAVRAAFDPLSKRLAQEE